jgi:predicted NBD/HSP70 family sugar kinase
MKVLVLDIGGTNVKLRFPGQQATVKLPTGPNYTPERLLADLKPRAARRKFDAVTIGFPAPVVAGKLPLEPDNLGPGWTDFRFDRAFRCPVRLINDAAMQAMGCYRGGRMLFLSLGTGLGAALIADFHVIGLELCHLRWSRQQTLEQRLGKPAMRNLGKARWTRALHNAVEMLRAAFVPDDLAIGGGGIKHLKVLPEGCRRAANQDALTGGELLWNDSRFRI